MSGCKLCPEGLEEDSMWRLTSLSLETRQRKASVWMEQPLEESLGTTWICSKSCSVTDFRAAPQEPVANPFQTRVLAF